MLWEYVEEAPIEEEVGRMVCESHVTLVKLDTHLPCGRRHIGGHILGCTCIEMYWAILCWQQQMR